MTGVSSPGLLATVALGEPVSSFSALCSSLCQHFDSWLDVLMGILGLWRVNHNVLKALCVVQRCHAVYLLSPFPFKVLKGLKGEVIALSQLGENFTSQMEIALFAESFAFCSSFSIRPFKEWVGQGRLGPLTRLPWEPWHCNCESGKPCCPQVWAKLSTAHCS